MSQSLVEHAGTTYVLVRIDGEKRLVVRGDYAGFDGTPSDDGLLCPLTPENAVALRARLPWLNPVPLGLRTSAGFGDRLGLATPGHVQAVSGTGVAPIFAQQSVRENARTRRTPQQVLDDAMWGVFEGGWRDDWGADADHIKTAESSEPFVRAGYTFFTIDPGDHVDDSAETDDRLTLEQKTRQLDWDTLETTLEAMRGRYRATPVLEFDEHTLLKALVKYGAAVAHTVKLARHIAQLQQGKPFDLEMSVDETHSTTALHEHFFIASELQRLGIRFVSLAPRFVGRFEKGVDYIGDLAALDENIAGHAVVMRAFDNAYKLSLHTGSDKFSVYPIATQHTRGRVHLKTAGTSYLEALRLMSMTDPTLFRQVLDFARARYETDRVTYHVSGHLANVPASADLTDEQLPDLLNQFDARQLLHVTFGSVLTDFYDSLFSLLHNHESEYHRLVCTHFKRHLELFKQ